MKARPATRWETQAELETRLGALPGLRGALRSIRLRHQEEARRLVMSRLKEAGLSLLDLRRAEVTFQELIYRLDEEQPRLMERLSDGTSVRLGLRVVYVDGAGDDALVHEITAHPFEGTVDPGPTQAGVETIKVAPRGAGVTCGYCVAHRERIDAARREFES